MSITQKTKDRIKGIAAVSAVATPFFLAAIPSIYQNEVPKIKEKIQSLTANADEVPLPPSIDRRLFH